MITQAIQSLVSWSVPNCAGDNIWKYNKARFWSHLVLGTSEDPCEKRASRSDGETETETEREREREASKAPSENKSAAREPEETPSAHLEDTALERIVQMVPLHLLPCQPHFKKVEVTGFQLTAAI
ncbi:hypothetical protein Q5P01_019791 [Channa striata]|uniref:Uncharacterized protein n=1 Tax=Channa striata TaxID=64152 RepID=A0AA88M253_CHASR|nr:hypothetical protein Q5P01_019791 [Channa striata]